MNKRERDTICAQIAAWEWRQGGSSSEAAAFGSCASDLASALDLSASDLSFYRAWEIYKLTKNEEDDAYLDALCDRVDDDYQALLDLIDTVGPAQLHAALSQSTSAGRVGDA